MPIRVRVDVRWTWHGPCMGSGGTAYAYMLHGLLHCSMARRMLMAQGVHMRQKAPYSGIIPHLAYFGYFRQPNRYLLQAYKTRNSVIC